MSMLGHSYSAWLLSELNCNCVYWFAVGRLSQMYDWEGNSIEIELLVILDSEV